MAFWSVAQTQPFCERKAAKFLGGQAFGCYLPKFKVTTHSRTLKRTFERALFSRYLFVQIENTWHAINSTPGVARLLLDGSSSPIVVRDSVIAELRSREDR